MHDIEANDKADSGQHTQPLVVELKFSSFLLVRTLLPYLYSLKLPELPNHPADFYKAFDVFETGEKFGVPELKSAALKCLKVICERCANYKAWIEDGYKSTEDYVDTLKNIWLIAINTDGPDELRRAVIETIVVEGEELVQDESFLEWLQKELQKDRGFMREFVRASCHAASRKTAC